MAFCTSFWFLLLIYLKCQYSKNRTKALFWDIAELEMHGLKGSDRCILELSIMGIQIYPSYFVAVQSWMKVLNVMLNALSCLTIGLSHCGPTPCRLCGCFNYIANAVLRLLHHKIFMCDLINSRYDWVSPITNIWKRTCNQVRQVL